LRTVEVGAELADCEPYRFEAVTTMRSVEPTSPVVAPYVDF
jgi:hypothetical protein